MQYRPIDDVTDALAFFIEHNANIECRPMIGVPFREIRILVPAGYFDAFTESIELPNHGDRLAFARRFIETARLAQAALLRNNHVPAAAPAAICPICKGAGEIKLLTSAVECECQSGPR